MESEAAAYVAINHPLNGVRPPRQFTKTRPTTAPRKEQFGFAGDGSQWVQHSFDLIRWKGQHVELFWSLYLGNTPATAPGWTIGDMLIEAFNTQVWSYFVAGPIWTGTSTTPASWSSRLRCGPGRSLFVRPGPIRQPGGL